MADLIVKELESFHEPAEVGLIIWICLNEFSLWNHACMFEKSIDLVIQNYIAAVTILKIFYDFLGDDILQCPWSSS